MKKSVSQILALLVLLNVNNTFSQDIDTDLESLLDSDSASEVDESSIETSSNDATDSVDVSEDTSTEASEPSSDTVDISELEALETTPPVEEAKATIPEDDFSADDLSELDSTSGDELDTLKADLADDAEFLPAPEATPPAPTTVEKKPTETKKEEVLITADVFDVGKEERELLSMANTIQGQIPDNEWNETVTAARVETYTVVKNDWLFKISKRFFGTGHFYPKIWSLNSFITNPHYIEPGMVLSFTTGSGAMPPQVKLGTFTSEELNSTPGANAVESADNLANFGEDVTPKWLDEKKQLENQGVYFQYASEENMDDLLRASEQALNKEYENYEPPKSDFDVIVPKNYDKSGFDKTSKIYYSFKEGFYLSTFVTTNIVQDFGEITNGPDENMFFSTKDHAFVKFNESMNVLPGDKFSIYSSMGKAKHKQSDREGYKYAIVGQIKLIRKIKDKWEVEFIEVAGTPERGDRITTYTPKIEKITRTYNSRLVEAAILSTFNYKQAIVGFGDVIYLDRGRADGVEMGNVFEVYGFKDRLLKEKITDQPTYKLGELTVITLSDNFATAIVTNSIRDFYVGDIAMTKTKESYLREVEAKRSKGKSEKELLGGKALEELDVELNLDNLNDDLLKQADKIELTEDELAELERQEREKSVISDSERDLKSLERLENEIEQAEKILNDARLDEDKLLENENLNDLEKKQGNLDQDSLEDIEENLGKRYIDEDLNSKDNPYGLTEFDVEEVDELLNVEKKE